MTKKLLMIAFALLWSGAAMAQGVEFRPLSFAQALETAKAEGKPLFIDCYTTWCGPCKTMTNEVFPLKEAGDYFNTRFVCAKFDMEAEGDGKEIAARYKVNSYPTFLILDASGGELHRVMGSNQLPTFIERVEAGLNLPKPVEELAKEYDAGTITEADLRAYLAYLRTQGQAQHNHAMQAGDRLLEMLTTEQKVQAENWPLIKERLTDPLGATMNFAIEHRAELRKNMGAQEVDTAMSLPFDIAFYMMITQPTTPDMAISLPLYRERLQSFDLPDKDYLLLMSDFAGAHIEKRIDDYLALFDANAAILPAQNIVNLCVGALEQIYGNKALNTRFGSIMAKARDAQTAPETRTYFDNVAMHYRRVGTVGTVWNEFGGFDASLAEAVRENKVFFIYTGTDTAMDAVFAEEKAGDFFNSRFISMRVDDPALIERFGVTQRPSYLILNHDGTVHHRFWGVLDADTLISRATEAFKDGWSPR